MHKCIDATRLPKQKQTRITRHITVRHHCSYKQYIVLCCYINIQNINYSSLNLIGCQGFINEHLAKGKYYIFVFTYI